MQHHVVVALVVAGSTWLAGCASGVPRVDGDDAGGGPPGVDAAKTVDAPASPDAAVDAPPSAAMKLLLTEVVLAPSMGEFVEISNPNATAVDLSTYYLSDSGTYFRVPTGTPTVDTADFIARFPAGAMIPAHGTITVALDAAAAYTTAYGSAPTYAIVGGTMTVLATNGVASLTNAGELLVLFRWDGSGDLVDDVDLILAGVPSVTNGLVDKSGAGVDGPDANSTPTMYAADARTIAAQATTPASGKSTKRIAPEGTHQLHSGSGNGITGDDETSENSAMTWDTAYTAPTPGTIPTALLP